MTPEVHIDECPQGFAAAVPRRPNGFGLRSRSLCGNGPARQGCALRRLPGQLRDVAGKALDKPPRAVAQMLVERLRLDDLLEPPEIAGPGFINLRMRTDWLRGRSERRPRTTGSALRRRRRRRPSSSTTARRTSPSRCTSATCAAPSSATRWPGCCASSAITSSRTITSATGGRSSASSFTDTSICGTRRRSRPTRCGSWPGSTSRCGIGSGRATRRRAKTRPIRSRRRAARRRPSCIRATRRTFGCGRCSCRRAWKRSTRSTGDWTSARGRDS